MIDKFFTDIETECISDNSQEVYDNLQNNKIGNITIMMGVAMLALIIIPNPIWGRILFLACSIIVLLIGFALKRNVNIKIKPSILHMKQ